MADDYKKPEAPAGFRRIPVFDQNDPRLDEWLKMIDAERKKQKGEDSDQLRRGEDE